MKNKKATSLISIYWFLVLGIIAGGIFLMVSSFYGSPYDVREMEAELLGNHVANCISPEGKMNHLLIIGGKPFPEFIDTFEDKCNLHLEGKEDWEVKEYYVQAKVYEKGVRAPTFNLTAGNKNFLSDCGSEEVFKKSATCFERTYYSYDSLEKPWKIEILSIVAKVKENIK